MDHLRELIAQKDKIQEQIKHLNHKCESMDQQKSLSSNLVDAQGFPRADLNFGDLSEYRNSKRKLNELNNDHLALMKQIEAGLYILHAEKKKDGKFQQQVVQEEQKEQKEPSVHQIKPQPQQKHPKQPSKQPKYQIEYLNPFARLTVEPHSPAETGGLKTGDLLSEFGSVNIYTPDNIKSIPKHVAEGVPVKIVVLREAGGGPHAEKVHTLAGREFYKIVVSVRPEKWAGRGILGCKIDPLLN